MDRLLAKVGRHEEAVQAHWAAQDAWEASRLSKPDSDDDDVKPIPPPVPRGLYVWGPVGSGKSMLMDMFHDAAPVQRKRRVHFHAFMADVHAQLHALNQARLAAEGRGWHVSRDPAQDSVAQLAKNLARSHWLLAFDEFQVSDVADALLASRLFAGMWAQGAVVVATSNRPPEDLYKDGLNRQYFLPFIAALQRQCRALHLTSAVDHRQSAPAAHSTWAEGRQGLHALAETLSPIDDVAATHLVASADIPPPPGAADVEAVDVGGGRSLPAQRLSPTTMLCDFAALCEEAVSPTDIRRLLVGLRCLVLTGAPPSIKAGESDTARRFIHLVDEVYERRVLLLVQGASPREHILRHFTTDAPAASQPSPDLVSDSSLPLDPAGQTEVSRSATEAAKADIAFAAGRALSRLAEMATGAYLDGAIAERTRQRSSDGAL